MSYINLRNVELCWQNKKSLYCQDFYRHCDWPTRLSSNTWKQHNSNKYRDILGNNNRLYSYWFSFSKYSYISILQLVISILLFSFRFDQFTFILTFHGGTMAMPIVAREDDKRVISVESRLHRRWSGKTRLVTIFLMFEMQNLPRELTKSRSIKKFLLSFGSWWLGSLFNNSSGDSFALHSRNLEILPFFQLLSLVLPRNIKRAKQDGNMGIGLTAASAMHVTWCKIRLSICSTFKGRITTCY